MISRRTFLAQAVAGALLCRRSSVLATRLPYGEVLYNGITLGAPWPPQVKYPDEHPIRPPYLAAPPPVIPIDVGRQLFVDDFLIEHTTLGRTFHPATYHPANPILRPERPWEMRDEVAERTGRRPNPSASPFSDGVFFDPADRLFKMWYMAGYGSSTCLAVSEDGLAWHRPDLDVVPGTNIVSTGYRDSTTVWLDLWEPDPQRRYKMSMWYDHALVLLVSPDGVHWEEIGTTGRTGDRSTFFYNPFRKVWVFSLRADQFEGATSGRYRRYWESPNFAPTENWAPDGTVAWVKADSRDFAAPWAPTPAELYTLDGVAYESLMLGLFSVWRGESNTREKINEITLGFSRDGFHWDRPDRSSFLPVSDDVGSWNWANIQSSGGAVLIVGDRLHFYVSGREGRPGTHDPGVCTTGLATLRRDGFASMDWLPESAPVVRGTARDGTLTTRPVRFSGGHLFVNADLRGGEMRVEVLDADERVIAPFTRERCAPLSGDGTRLRVQWSAGTLGALAGQAVRFRFTLTRGRIYAFWVSPWTSGESSGPPAAGGPEFSGPLDVPVRA